MNCLEYTNDYMIRRNNLQRERNTNIQEKGEREIKNVGIREEEDNLRTCKKLEVKFRAFNRLEIHPDIIVSNSWNL